MTPTLQLLQKCELPAGSWLTINAPLDWSGSGLLSGAAQQYFSDEWYVARSMENCEFGVLPTLPAELQNVLLFLPKAKPRFVQLLEALAKQLGPQTTLWVVGENNGGVKSATKPLQACFQNVTKVGNAKRCGLLRCEGVLAERARPTDDSAAPLWHEYQDWQLASLPGLFNKGAVDKGTQLLLEHMPKVYGKVLDMGCGGGVLSLAAMQRGADSVTAVDSSAIALEATRLSAEKNAVDSIATIASDVFSDVPRDIGGSYEWVISNPPFHSGISTNYQPAQRLITEGKRYVKSGGRMLIVANRHLPYEQWLEGAFKRWEVLEQRDGFKVLIAYQ